jgi:hypothetical protein
MKCLSEEREQPNQWVRGTSSAPGRGPLWRGCVFLLRAQFVDNPRAVVDQVLWSRKQGFVAPPGVAGDVRGRSGRGFGAGIANARPGARWVVSDLAGSGAGEGFGVSRIFLSHSSAENRAAAALKRRLAAQRPETGQRDDLPRHRPGFRAAAGVSVEAPVVQEHLPRCGSTPPRCISLNRRRCSPNCQR